MQRLTGAELLNKVREEKMSLNDEDSYFDDMITLYIGKGVANFQTDEKILGPLTKLNEEHTGADLPYYRGKLNRARLNQGIDDPRVARNKFSQNVVYIKATNKYFACIELSALLNVGWLHFLFSIGSDKSFADDLTESRYCKC